MLPANRVYHLKLKTAVALFRYCAADTVAQCAKPVALISSGAIIVSWNHSVHHLGVITQLSIPPVQLIWFSPGPKAGNSGAVTYWFRFVPSL